MADRVLTQLLSVPSNRSCADCRAALIDTLQVYASFSSPTPCLKRPRRQQGGRVLSLDSFHRNHQALRPTVSDEDDDPLKENVQVFQYGVFVCAPCAAAHARTTSIVKPVHQASSWDDADIRWFESIAGNASVNSVLERYIVSRPNMHSTVSERLEFCRAKYLSLAFCLPPYGPLAKEAWQSLVDGHPEWEQCVWGTALLEHLESETVWNDPHKTLDLSSLFLRSNTIQQLPEQLIDYFCIVSATDECLRKLEKTGRLEEFKDNDALIPLTPCVTDCFPQMDTKTFPNAIASFCFPEECCGRTTAVPPTFFTQVLTNGAGQRIYAAILCIHDPNPQAIYIPKCLVILSHYAFFDLFRKILLQLNRIALTEAPLPMERFIANLFEVPLPPQGKIKIRFGFTASDIWEISRPPPNQLPMVNFSFEPLFACLSIPNVLTVIGCLLSETRVALLSQHASLLCPVAEALLHLLFPLHWSGLYIPVLPYHMLELLEAPVPYLLGIHSRYIRHPQRCKTTVYVLLDEDVVHLGCDDATIDSREPRKSPVLPERLAAKLRSRLIKAVGHNAYCTPGQDRITTGAELRHDIDVREGYAQTVDHTHIESRRRKDVLGNIDKAYRDNEWLVPIHGFLSETGQFHSKQTVSLNAKQSTPNNKRGVGKKFHFRSFRKDQGSQASPSEHTATVTSQHSSNATPDQGTRSILDMTEPDGFSTQGIRDAFLRFFVSLLQDYRLYLASNGFRAEEFVESITVSDRAFVHSLIRTQLFECFIAERRECLDDPEVRFFDESIIMKFNRSKMVLARGGKKETTFLGDTSYEVKETFSPPPPSNWGLPDNGALYHYSTFPRFNNSLFGKIRAPKPWEKDANDGVTISRLTVLTRRRSAYGFANSNFASSRPGFFRPKQSFDAAIKTLSAPFSGRKVGMTINPFGASEHSIASDLSLNSSFGAPDGDSTGLHIAQNARRRQIILVNILTKLQACCRSYLARKRRLRLQHGREKLRYRSKSGIISKDIAAIVIQARYRSKIHQTRLRRMRSAVERILAFHQGNRIRAIFRTIRAAAIRVQATYRGISVSRELSGLVVERMELYRCQIFELWNLLATPLCYRSVFWSYLVISKPCKGFIRLALAEDELERLWGELNNTEASHKYRDNDGCRSHIENSLRNRVYLQCLTIQHSLENENDAIESILKHRNGLAQSAVSSVIAERKQVYGKLSKLSESDADVIFGRFSIKHGQKKKKAMLSQLLWSSFKDADVSALSFIQLFPEIRTSSRVEFVVPPKKALRLFATNTGMPYEIPSNVHCLLDDRIRRHVLEIARASFSRFVGERATTP